MRLTFFFLNFHNHRTRMLENLNEIKKGERSEKEMSTAKMADFGDTSDLKGEKVANGGG